MGQSPRVTAYHMRIWVHKIDQFIYSSTHNTKRLLNQFLFILVPPLQVVYVCVLAVHHTIQASRDITDNSCI